MKRTLSAILLLIFSLSITSCSLTPAKDTLASATETEQTEDTEAAEDALTIAMEAVKNADIETAKEYFGGFSLSTNDDEEVASEGGFIEENFSALFTKLSYKIGSVKVDGDTAEAKIKITNINMANVYYGSINSLIDSILDEQTEEEQTAKLSDSITTLIEEEETFVTTTVTVNMTCEEEKWTIESSKEFIKALMGGLDPSASESSRQE